MRIRLNSLSISGRQGPGDILIADGLFTDVSPSQQDHAGPGSDLTLSLPGAIAFPGLINSHDHLDFNLFPRLGNATYSNYTEWGNDIHLRNRKEIDAVLEIPQPLRTTWGIYKNLLNGFTTVVNHGETLPVDDELITVFQNQRCLHSVGFEKGWRWQLNRPGRFPVVIHVGEGTDKTARDEISRLLRWNLFKKNLIGVHGVAMDETQAKGFQALVWCPASNYFLLNSTAPIHKLKHHVPILFGTDATLTAPWDAWEQIRLARQQQMLTDEELLDSLTRQAADTWKLHTGEIAPGFQADLVVSAAADVFSTTPEDILLVLHKGQIRLFDASLDIGPQPGFYKISVGERNKYVKGDLPTLMKEIQKHYPAVAFPDTIGYAITPSLF
ncbi:MAG TPA: amidohydrolase family protein [Puia sp.]